MTPEVLRLITALIESIMHDEQRSGGLLSRKSLRLAAELAMAARDAALAQVIETPPQPLN